MTDRHEADTAASPPRARLARASHDGQASPAGGSMPPPARRPLPAHRLADGARLSKGPTSPVRISHAAEEFSPRASAAQVYDPTGVARTISSPSGAADDPEYPSVTEPAGTSTEALRPAPTHSRSDPPPRVSIAIPDMARLRQPASPTSRAPARPFPTEAPRQVLSPDGYFANAPRRPRDVPARERSSIDPTAESPAGPSGVAPSPRAARPPTLPALHMPSTHPPLPPRHRSPLIPVPWDADRHPDSPARELLRESPAASPRPDAAGDGTGAKRGSSSSRTSAETGPGTPAESPSSARVMDYGTQPARRPTPLGHAHGAPGFGRPRSARGHSHSRDSARGRNASPMGHWGSPRYSPRPASQHSAHSSDGRPLSYVDLLNVPYPQQPSPATAATLDHSHLRSVVGANASLLSHQQTLEMYRANAKKTTDPATLYEFALFLSNTARAAGVHSLADENTAPKKKLTSSKAPKETESADAASADAEVARELLNEARQILQRLADRSYPFAQYYLADGYTSGLFSKLDRPELDKAFPLFLAAGKHGHAESAFRAALSYQHGWGCRKDPAKAVQWYRQSASKNHPGAMTTLGMACLEGDLGLDKRYREGVKWLKRAAESADFQYNAAPYELGRLHETGYRDDLFQDDAYAAQLFTTSAEFGHVEASYRLGDAYEHGKLSLPKDPSLSVHFYNAAARAGHPLAMMALCAWYMVGAAPTLERDENEAYQWALRAAHLGLAKAEYAVAYFSETGIGCRRDVLEANMWYVRAASQGDERAKARLATIRDGALDDPSAASGTGKGKQKATGKDEKDRKAM
ncbi:MAG: hypothetical protein M1826_003778 [Phylliscum demangeonii]|nr:MAG: hypothetical protein M1826_003778 [Phylliscum demangeonii]